MTQIGFNKQAIGLIVEAHDRDVRNAEETCAFVPIVVQKPGIEAIKEGLRLANIEGFNSSLNKPGKDVDAG